MRKAHLGKTPKSSSVCTHVHQVSRRSGKEEPLVSRLNLFLIAGLILLVDQTTKFFILRDLVRHGSVPVIPPVFYLTFLENRGVAFGFLDNFSDLLLIVIAVSVVILIGYPIFQPFRSRYERLAYAFILGGAVGNLIDRIRLGFVVDFLDFRIWPVFNVADMFISIGVGLFILKTFFPKVDSHAS